MRTTKLGAWVGVWLGTLASVPSGSVRADSPPRPDPPRSKRVPVAPELDWGVFADRVARPYTVKTGDTLRGIAAAQCGDAARWTTLAETNPAVSAAPDKLQPGDVLWLPPARAFAPAPPAPAAAPSKAPLEPWYDAFWGAPLDRTHWSSGLDRFRERVGDRAAPDAPPTAGALLLLVPHADTAAVLERRATAPVLVGGPELARTLWARFGVNNLVHGDEPTARIEVRYRLTGREGLALTVTTDERRFNAAGAVVAKPVPGEARRTFWLPGEPSDPPTPTPAPAPEPEPEPVDDGVRWPAWVGLLVAGIGAAVVAAVVLVRRRRSPDA